jgi:hypothetical protein
MRKVWSVLDVLLTAGEDIVVLTKSRMDSMDSCILVTMCWGLLYLTLWESVESSYVFF